MLPVLLTYTREKKGVLGLFMLVVREVGHLAGIAL